jgi:hypothetical protein
MDMSRYHCIRTHLSRVFSRKVTSTNENHFKFRRVTNSNMWRITRYPMWSFSWSFSGHVYAGILVPLGHDSFLPYPFLFMSPQSLYQWQRRELSYRSPNLLDQLVQMTSGLLPWRLVWCLMSAAVTPATRWAEQKLDGG